MKKSLTLYRRKVGRAMDKFLHTVGSASEDREREYKSRLQEIEEEMEREREKQNRKEGNYKE